MAVNPELKIVIAFIMEYVFNNDPHFVSLFHVNEAALMPITSPSATSVEVGCVDVVLAKASRTSLCSCIVEHGITKHDNLRVVPSAGIHRFDRGRL